MKRVLLFNLAKSDLSFEIVSLVSEDDGVDCLWTKTAHEDTWVHLFVESCIDSLTIRELKHFVSFVY